MCLQSALFVTTHSCFSNTLTLTTSINLHLTVTRLVSVIYYSRPSRLTVILCFIFSCSTYVLFK